MMIAAEEGKVNLSKLAGWVVEGERERGAMSWKVG